MKDLALFIVKALADWPDKVSVSESEQGQTTLLRLSVAEEDKGKIIGKQGKVIKAIRSLILTSAAKQGKKVTLDIE